MEPQNRSIYCSRPIKHYWYQVSFLCARLEKTLIHGKVGGMGLYTMEAKGSRHSIGREGRTLEWKIAHKPGIQTVWFRNCDVKTCSLSKSRGKNKRERHFSVKKVQRTETKSFTTTTIPVSETAFIYPRPHF